MRRITAFMVVGILALLPSLAAAAQAVDSKPKASDWQPGIFYNTGSVVKSENVSYKCIYSHTAVAGWEPEKTPALWQPLSIRHTAPNQDHKDPRQQLTRMFAPYIHMSETDSNLSDIQARSRIRFFSLAFIVSDGGCSPAWQGKTLLPVAAETSFVNNIERVRKSGGDVIISFGGYVGQELGLACPDAGSLVAAYQTVVDKYKAKRLDFDIEAGAATDAASIERRNEALRRLTRRNPGLEITFTVPVFSNGLPETAISILKSAQEHDVPISLINLMTMDYGQPVPDGNMGPMAIVAVDAAIAQIRSLGLPAVVGITPMIGANDVAGETFTLADARALLSFARLSGAVRRLSMWSVGRDRGGCLGSVSPTCSGIAQGDWEFTRVFQEF
jgi:chitinase